MEKYWMKRVAIIGQGYVGLTIAVAASQSFTVIGFDTDERIVDQLNRGESHIEGVSNSYLAKRIQDGKFKASTNAADISDCEVVVIAVPTPLTMQREPDLSHLHLACQIIGENISKPALIINESTSFPGTLRNFIKPTIEKFSTVRLNHEYAISPERVDPGRTNYTQKNTPRLFSGMTSAASLKTKIFYSSFCDELVEVSSPEVAEAAKLFENTFRQVNIALVNEFAQITHALGINVYETLDAANTKPYGFMKFKPGAGVGGHCIPIDPTYLATIAEQYGAPATFIRRANEVNLHMTRYIAKRILEDHDGNLRDKSVLLVGVAYKSDVADVRETPAEQLQIILSEMGAKVKWHDDVVKTWRGEKSSPLNESDIAIVVTLHSKVDAKKVLAAAPYVFDTTGSIPGAHFL